MVVKGEDLRQGDRIMHPVRQAKKKEVTWRHVYTVAKKPYVSPGAWQLSCECIDASGKKARIAVGPTQQVNVERKG